MEFINELSSYWMARNEHVIIQTYSKNYKYITSGSFEPTIYTIFFNWLSWYCPNIFHQSNMYSSSLACGNLESSKQSSFSGLFCQLSGTESWRALGMLKDSGLIFTQITKYRQIQHQQHEISFFYFVRNPYTLEYFTVTYSYMNMPLDRVEKCQVTSICTNLYTFAWTPTISCDLEVFLTMGAR